MKAHQNSQRGRYLAMLSVRLADKFTDETQLWSYIHDVENQLIDGHIQEFGGDASRAAFADVLPGARYTRKALLKLSAEKPGTSQITLCSIEGVSAANLELDKRLHVPYVVSSPCPTCKRLVEVDLSGGDHYLSSPRIGQPTSIYFVCEEDHEAAYWQVQAKVNLTLTLIE